MVFEVYCFWINNTVSIFYDKNGKGEQLDVSHQFPDRNCWEMFYENISCNDMSDKEDDKDDFRGDTFIYTREKFPKTGKNYTLHAN